MMPPPTIVTFTPRLYRPWLSLHWSLRASHTSEFVSPHPSRRAPSASVELVLYVSAASTYAASAARNCEALLARFDRGAVRLEICDVSEHPDRAETDGICFTPVLLKKQPLPRTYILGDLSNTAALLDLLVSCGVEPLDEHSEKDSHRRSRL